MTQATRAVRILFHIFLGLLLIVVTGALLRNDLAHVKKAKRWWLRKTTALLNIQIHVIGALPEHQSKGVLFVSNHVSWADIPVIGGLTQLSFLSKAELRSWPLIGLLARGAGTLFINRGAGDTVRVGNEISARLAQGNSVLFFPEGTTSEGITVGKFHRKLFRVCEAADISVCPITLNYSVPGETHNPVAFIGEDTFAAHLWNLLKYPSINVTVNILETREIDVSDLKNSVVNLHLEMKHYVEQNRNPMLNGTNVQYLDEPNPVYQENRAANL